MPRTLLLGEFSTEFDPTEFDTESERDEVSALRSQHYAKFEIQDADLVYRDYTQYFRTDWLTQASIEESIDQSTMTLNATLLRQSGTLSLSPFIAASLINRNSLGSYATAIDAWRKWRLSVAVRPEGYPPTGSDWKEMCQGRIDRIEWSGENIIITGRGEEAVLLDFWIAAERQYGSVGGIAMETTLQTQMDDNIGASVYPLYTPVSPSYLMLPWTQPKDRLFPSMVAVADKAGHVLRFRYDSLDAFRLTLFKPNRTAVPGNEVWSIGANEILNYTKVGIDKQPIRNFIKIRFVHPTLGTQTVISPWQAGVGTVSCAAGVATFSNTQASIIKTVGSKTEIVVGGIAYTINTFNGTTGATLIPQLATGGLPTFGASPFTLSDTVSGSGNGSTASIDRFGRNDLEMDLAFTTQVTDPTKAQAMADAVRSDTEFPNLEQQFECLGFWFVQLHDYGKFLANGVHYDQDQYGGVTSIRHDIANGTIRSTIGVRGKPSGKYTGWRYSPGVTDGGFVSVTTVPLFLRAKVLTTDATQVVFRVSVADAAPLSDVAIVYVSQGVGTISPASPQTIAKALITNDIETTGYVDITIIRGTGAGAGRITFTASSPNRVSSTDSGDIQQKRLAGGGAAPTLSSPQGFWSGTNAITGTDTAGRITLDHTAATGSAQSNGHQIKVTFAVAYSAPPFVLIGPVAFNDGHYTVGTVTANDFWLDAEVATTVLAGTVGATSATIPYAVIG